MREPARPLGLSTDKGDEVIVPCERVRTIIGLSLPIASALLAQSLLSLTSVAIVSRIGYEALAGVGIANAFLSMLMALLFGIDTGGQVLVARRVGAGQVPHATAALQDGIAVATVAGLLLVIA